MNLIKVIRFIQRTIELNINEIVRPSSVGKVFEVKKYHQLRKQCASKQESMKSHM